MGLSEAIQRMLMLPDPMKPFWEQLYRDTVSARAAECRRVLGIEDKTPTGESL